MTFAERLALRVAVFAAGALLMALEVAAFRMVGKTFGAALRETTAVIAVFLAAMSAGYWAGGRAADRWPRASTLAGTLVAAAIVLLFVPQIDAALSPRIATSGLALSTHAFLAATILFALPTFLLAATSPIAVRLFTTSAVRSGSTAGSISAISTAGSIAGSIVAAFLLIDWLESITRTVIFVAAGTLVTALLVVAAGAQAGRRSRGAVGAAAGVALLAILAAALFLRSGSMDAALLKPLPGTRFVFVGDSPYHRIVVQDRGPLREMKFNFLVQSSMTRTDPLGPGLSYTDTFHIAPLLRPSVRRVLQIGLGGGTAARQFASLYPEAIVDVVEVDPLVVDVAKRHFGVIPSERLRIHVADGRTFLARSSERWDLIIVDAYTASRYGDTIPAHLTTREFFTTAAAHLTDGGIVHFHCAFGGRLLQSIHATMASVFPNVIHTRGEILASHTPLIADVEALRARAKTSPAARFPTFYSAVLQLRSDPPPRDALLLTDDYAPVDTL
ncbi:MAG TPA: fused MFS/spermidine synthase [Thermoanaerobaculia bacterium]